MQMDKKWILVSSFFCLLGFVFGATDVELGTSTEGNLSKNNLSYPLPLPKNVDELVLDGIIMPKNYSKNFSMKSLPDLQMAFVVLVDKIVLLEEQAKVNISLRVDVQWTDARLKLAPNSNITNYFKVAPLTALDNIWHPGTQILGNTSSESAFTYDVKRNQTHILYWKTWNRTDGVECIRFRRDTNVTFQQYVDMNYVFFPNDKHMTTFWLRANDGARFSPMRIPVRYGKVYFWNKDFKDDDKFDIRVTSTAFTDMLQNKSSDRFDFNVLFDRKMGTYTYKIYVPCGFFVILSFLGWLLPAKVAGERVALCATTLLTVTVFYNDAPTGTAQSYLRAIDIWLLGCIAFVFLILIQSIVFFRITSKIPKKKQRKDAGTEDIKQAINSLSIQLDQMQDKLGGGGSDLLPHISVPPEPPAPHDKDLDSKAQAPLEKDEDDETRRRKKISQWFDRLSLIFLVLILTACNWIYWDWLLNGVPQTCDWDEQCREHFIDTDEYGKSTENLKKSLWKALI